MLLARQYEPKETEILYHYCSAASLEAIMRTGSIRLGDISMMNDAYEMRWGYRVFEDAVTEILTKPIPNELSGFGKEFADEIDKILSPLSLQVQPFIACFTKEPDQLSQWRGYADDGRGFAIGFSATALKALPVTLLEVAYDHKQQVQEMKVAIASIFMRDKAASSKFGSEFRQDCLLLGAFLAGLKNPSFHEEKEVRALHLVPVRIDPHFIHFDPNSSDAGSGKIQFRTDGPYISAFLDLKISQELRPIREVILGPKNQNAPGNIIIMASHYGHGDVMIKHSSGSYR